MFDNNLVGIPLSIVDIRAIYLEGNGLKDTKRNRHVVLMDDIRNYLLEYGYRLLTVRYWNYSIGKMMKYYVIEKEV